MNKDFLPVVICSIIKENSILLIERNKGNYQGYLGLVGGKIEQGEHVREAAIREAKEETGLDTKFGSILSFISEIFNEEDSQKQFLLYLTELVPISNDVFESDEGNLHWINLEKLEEYKEMIIPSDYKMIEEIIKNNNGSYYECLIENKDKELSMEYFEKIQ